MEGEKSIKFYKEIDRILGHRTASEPAVLLSSNIDDDTIEAGEYTSVVM